MTQDNTTLTILSTRIRQDAQGRFCLNDCHRASGGSVNKRPGEWLRNEQTQSLVYELTDAGNPASPVSAIKGGSEQGTYVAKELVYAYAMWINPAFHLAVIRAFDAMVSSAVIKAPRPRRPSVLRTFNTAEVSFTSVGKGFFEKQSDCLSFIFDSLLKPEIFHSSP